MNRVPNAGISMQKVCNSLISFWESIKQKWNLGTIYVPPEYVYLEILQYPLVYIAIWVGMDLTGQHFLCKYSINKDSSNVHI